LDAASGRLTLPPLDAAALMQASSLQQLGAMLAQETGVSTISLQKTIDEEGESTVELTGQINPQTTLMTLGRTDPPSGEPPLIETSNDEDKLLSKQGARQVLDNAFGHIRVMALHALIAGTVETLDQNAFKAKWDEYNTTERSWDNWVVPRYGTLLGFAVRGENLIFLNGAMATEHFNVDSSCVGSWAEVKAAMDARDWALARAKLARRETGIQGALSWVRGLFRGANRTDSESGDGAM
jgi:hypothetical protein